MVLFQVPPNLILNIKSHTHTQWLTYLELFSNIYTTPFLLFLSLKIQNLFPLSHDYGPDLVTDFWQTMWWEWHSWPPRLGKRHCSFHLVFSLRSFILGEANSHVTKALKQLCGEAHMIRNWGLHPTAMSTPSWNSSFSSEAWDDLNPSQHFDYNLTRDPEPEPHSEAWCTETLKK